MSIPSPDGGASAARRYRIDDVNLAARRELLKFDSRDVEAVRALSGLARR